MASQSLLWLQENNDVWKKVMIELVKCRKNKVLKELDEIFDDFWYDYEYNNDTNYHLVSDDYCEEIHSGRKLLYWKKIRNSDDNKLKLNKLSRKFKQRMFVFGYEIETIKSKLRVHTPWVYVRWKRFWDIIPNIKALVKYDFTEDYIDTDVYNFDKNSDIKKFLLKMDDKDIKANVTYCSIENKFCGFE